MSRASILIGAVGVALALGGLVAYASDPGLLWLVSLLEGIALVCLIVFFVIHFETVKAFSVRRSTRLGFNSMLMAALFAGILVIINFLAARHSTRWDLSETQQFTLAPQTYSVLRALGRDVRIKVFSQDRSQGQKKYQELLSEYARISDKITVTYIDPDRDPEVARQYGIARADLAVVESGDQSSRVATPEEAELTSAIIRVSKDTKKQILFLEGHGERSIEDLERTGLGLARDALAKQAYDVRSLSLVTQETVPASAVVVVAGPKRPLAPEEIERLRAHVQRGGRLLLLIDPNADAGLAALVAPWGIELGKGVLMDRIHVAQSGWDVIANTPLPDHEITKDLYSKALVVFPAARYLAVHDDRAGDWTIAPLARTSPNSWAETNDAALRSGFMQLDEQDVRGPLTFAVALNLKKAPEAGKPAPAIVIVGNSQFATNAYLNYPGNSDFFLHIVGWLADERELLSIAPKTVRTFRPFLPSPRQEILLLLVQVLLLPVGTFVWGMVTWRRRRRL